MTFQQLTYVVEIFKCGSINKAAHKLVLPCESWRRSWASSFSSAATGA